MVGNPEFHLPCELVEWRFEHVGNLPRSAHGRIDDPALYPADVRPVEAALGAEAFLRVACLLQQFTHNSTDRSQSKVGGLDLLLASLHRQIRW
jgi:hypothetical protein